MKLQHTLRPTNNGSWTYGGRHIRTYKDGKTFRYIAWLASSRCVAGATLTDVCVGLDKAEAEEARHVK